MLKLLAGLVALLIIAIIPAYAQELPLEPSISTNKKSYELGEEVSITGYINPISGEQPAVLQIFNPSGAAYRFDYVEVEHDGIFSYVLKIGGPLAIGGTYEVRFVYGGETLVTQFEFEAIEVPLDEYTLYRGDTPFTIMYKMTDGTIESIDADEASATMTIKIKTESDGKLLIFLPGSLSTMLNLWDDTGSFNAIVFVDEIEEFIRDVNYDCSMTLEIPFSQGSEQIDIVGSSFPGTSQIGFGWKGSPIQAAVNAEDREFLIDVIANADMCDFSFNQEERQFHADVRGPVHGDGYFQITLPHHFLGGPYVVLVNDEPVEFESVFSNAAGLHTTTISFQYDVMNARTIDIIGTTAIPEFSSIMVGAISITSAIAIARFRKCQ